MYALWSYGTCNVWEELEYILHTGCVSWYPTKSVNILKAVLHLQQARSSLKHRLHKLDLLLAAKHRQKQVTSQYHNKSKHACTHAHTHARTHARTQLLRPSWILSGTTRVSQHQKGKTRKAKSICIYWRKRQQVAVSTPLHSTYRAGH